MGRLRSTIFRARRQGVSQNRSVQDARRTSQAHRGRDNTTPPSQQRVEESNSIDMDHTAYDQNLVSEERINNMNTAQLEYENALPPDDPDPAESIETLADVEIGDTLVEYLASWDGENFTDYHQQTRRLNPNYPESSRVKWVDPNGRHETLLDAVEDAFMYLNNGQKAKGGMQFYAGILHAQAELAELKFRSA